MLKNFKHRVFQKLSTTLTISDNGNFEGEYPQIMLRVADYNRRHYLNTRMENISFTLDIFSLYSGEEEIIDLESKISELMAEVAKEDPKVMGWMLKTMKIMDNNNKGPVNKHGILTYQFMLAVGDDNE